jgi:hypothetical protein
VATYWLPSAFETGRGDWIRTSGGSRRSKYRSRHRHHPQVIVSRRERQFSQVASISTAGEPSRPFDLGGSARRIIQPSDGTVGHYMSSREVRRGGALLV